MEFKNESLGVSFTIPEKITVRAQLAYFSGALYSLRRDLLERYWTAAVSIIQDWKCELIPDLGALDLDKADNPKIAEIILWAGLEVKTHMDNLDTVPKKLIQAAVESVDGDAPAPPDLRLAWECERWGCLPETGAYLDQEYGMMTRMSTLSTVYNAYAHYRNSHGAQIHNLSESERRVLKALIDMKLIGVA